MVGERKGELGWELTRLISSVIGVDLVRRIEKAREGIVEDVDVDDIGAGLLGYERSVAGCIFS